MKVVSVRLQIIFIFFAVVFSGTHPILAEDMERAAILPFRINAEKSLDYLSNSLQKNLIRRIGSRGFSMISPEAINKHHLAALPAFDTKDLFTIGGDLNARWVVAGSLWQEGEKLIVDIKVIDVIQKGQPFFISLSAENMDVLDKTMEKIGIRIVNQITGKSLVEEVQVKGNQRIEKEAILAVARTKKGDRLNYERLDRDLRDIYKMGFFEDIKIEITDGPDGKIVIFNVSEKPSISKITFEGNENIKSDKLEEELGIKLYSTLDQNEIKQTINRLKDLYRQKGYYNVEIKNSIEPLPENKVLLKYKIVEHEKVYIKHIQFSGNTRFKKGKLKDIMETSEKGLFSWLTDSGYLDTKKLEFDVHKITSFYHNHGYIKAKVGAPSISYEKDEGLTITIEINEGRQYGINKVLFKGDLIKPAEELLKTVRIDEEKVFNREIVRKDMEALREIYADEGYAYADISPNTIDDNEKYLVDVIYRISKGNKIRFERINISGNTVTRDKIIRRELKVIEGEYFSGKKLSRSEQNLNRLGFFDNITVNAKKGTRDDRMILDINIKEKPTGSFSFGAGYSSVDKVVGILQLSQNNLFGRGQRLAAALRVGGISNQFDISFTEPWLWDHPISGDIRIYKWEREYDDYTKDSFGTALSIGFPVDRLDDLTRGWVKYGYDDSDVTDIAYDAAYVIKEMEGRSVTSSLTFGLQRNSTDRPWNPTRGSINSISYKYAGGIFGGDNYYNKLTARSAWYFPLFWDTVFLAQGRWGFLEKRSGGNLPVYEKFFLGGINTVRGFDYEEISPRDPDTGDEIGGEKMMVYNLEYHFPLVKEQGIIGLVFFDAGNVFESDDNYTFSGIRMSAGGGIRWYSPMGPLRLEWGYNLDRKEDEPSGNFEFSVGAMF